ncbi:hypothetical protein [Echinicola salinicaeni]|uniref:hypothetical protein n=1 Tax=Echinicola salinicaeni TaxID=2762757 RepID=UPI001645F430|nr:hypothetical protein [Echinicola salinicaeni]
MLKTIFKSFLFTIIISTLSKEVSSQTSPEKINFVRQGVQRLIFDEKQAIPLASLNPKEVIGFSSMYPIKSYTEASAAINTSKGILNIQSEKDTETGIWFGGFNPFATYSIDLNSLSGDGEIGFQFLSATSQKQFIVKIGFKDSLLTDTKLKVVLDNKTIVEKSIAVNKEETKTLKGKIILQMLGSGLSLYLQDQGLPKVIGQSDFNKYLDLRKKEHINSLQSQLYIHLMNGQVQINKVEMALTTGVGLADIRAITYENGDPMLDQGRLWYSMSIRGRALPHHIQGVFSMDPTVFDIKLEGVILFDRKDGLLRNEIASHLFYDRNEQIWRGLTTGFSAYAFPDKEKKQLLAIESKRDPRFGFSVMDAVPFGMVGDIEDPHILFDEEVNKWRMLTCENQGKGYKAIVLESDHWNKGYTKISGPVAPNSTGTSIQKIDDRRYCFSGSSEREIFIYSYPDLKEVGTLKMDLPPWDSNSGTRVWPNIVQLPEGYPFPYIALMMDRYNYPGLTGPNWSYGALYLYHGNK